MYLKHNLSITKLTEEIESLCVARPDIFFEDKIL